MISLISMGCVLFCNPARAGLFDSVFDGRRQGFVFGGGIGAGVTLFSEEFGYWEENEGGIAYNFEIGYAPSNKYRICFLDGGMILTRGFAEKWREWNETVPVILPIFFSAFYWILMSDQLWGVSLTRYMKETSPSLFFNGGAGVYLPFAYMFEKEKDFEPKPGPGLCAGFGYEFQGGTAIALDMIWGKPSNVDVYDISFLLQFKKFYY